jgi:hypothetical protein
VAAIGVSKFSRVFLGNLKCFSKQPRFPVASEKLDEDLQFVSPFREFEMALVAWEQKMMVSGHPGLSHKSSTSPNKPLVAINPDVKCLFCFVP